MNHKILLSKWDFEKIKEYLISSQKLEVRSKCQQQVFDNGVFDITDQSSKEYSLLFYYKGYNQDWTCAQDNATRLSRFTNKNILQIFKSFQSEEFGFLLIEKCESTLRKWVFQNSILLHQKQLFIDISLQILKGAIAITEIQWPLGYICLDNILINKDKVIKLTNASFHPKYQLYNLKQDFENCNQQKKIFYFPLKYIEEKESQKQEEFYFKDISVYQIGLCLYAMSGASEEHIINFIQGKESFQIQYSLGLQINSAIAYILLQNQSKIGYSFIYKILENIQSELPKTNIDGIESQAIDSDHQNNLKTKIEKEEQEKIDQFMLNFLEGILNQNRNNHEQALESFHKCIQIEPNNEFSYYYIGLILYHYQKDYEESKQSLSQSIAINNSNGEAYILLGQIFEEQELIDQAKECYTSAIKCSNRDSRANALLGLIYYFVDEDKTISKSYMQEYSLDLNDFDDKNLERMAKYYSDNEDIMNAKTCYERLISKSKSNYKYYIDLIKVYKQNKYLYPSVVKLIQKAIALEPHRIEAYLELLNYYQSRNEKFKFHKLLTCKKMLEISKTQSLDIKNVVIEKVYMHKISSYDEKARNFYEIYKEILCTQHFINFFVKQTKSKI